MKKQLTSNPSPPPLSAKRTSPPLGASSLLDADAAQLEVIRKAAECKYNDGVICGLWDKYPERCARCGWNPNKGKTTEG